MIYKLLGALIIIASSVMTFLIFQDDLEIERNNNSANCIQLTPSQQLIKLIKDDFQSLTQSKQLPKEWDSIASIEIKLNSELARIIFGNALPTFRRDKNGKSHLELEIVDLPDKENPGIIIQASLFDKTSKNKIFEIGRTYTMNDLNRIPSKQQKSPKKENYNRQ